MLSFGSALRVIDVKTIYHCYFFCSSGFNVRFFEKMACPSAIVQNVVCEKFFSFYSILNFVSQARTSTTWKFHFLHTAYSDHVFLME